MSDLSICTIPELQTLSQTLTHYFSELQKQKEQVIMVLNREGDKFKYDFNSVLSTVDSEMKKIKEKMTEVNLEFDLRIKATLDIEMDIKPISKILTDFSVAYQEYKRLENNDYKTNLLTPNA